MLIAASSIVLLVMFIIPVGIMALSSFWTTVPGSLIPDKTLTLSNYKDILLRTGGYFINAYAHTLKLSIIATAITIVLAYPLAWLISGMVGLKKALFLALIMLPMISGAMIQTLGWIIIMYPFGLFNYILMGLKLISKPMVFLGKDIGVLFGLVQAYMPMMVLPLVTAIGSIDPSVDLAAQTLGAGFYRRFLEITVPLTVPGAVAGGFLVFLANLNAFVTPNVLGQGRIPYIAKTAYTLAIDQINFPLASAFSLFPFIIAISGYTLIKGFLMLKKGGSRNG